MFLSSASPLAYETVPVALGGRSYDILIGAGLLETAGDAIRSRFGAINAAIVSDKNVAALHLEALRSSLNAVEIKTFPIIVEAGEASKSWDMLETVWSATLSAKLERGDVVLALGGGVVGDLAGFAASIARRGMTFIQLPTSLLAQVDSSIGGKTGINTAHGKNLIGAFHQPSLVLADINTLDTLSKRHLRAGYAEIVKYGLINSMSFFQWLEKNWQEVLAGNNRERLHAVATSCRAKAAIVAADEREAGERALLNLGHTFGHALERATGYSERLVHGEAISIGMVMAHRFSSRMNLASPNDAERVKLHFDQVGLPTELSHIKGTPPDHQELMEYIAQDKKVIRGGLTFILTRGIGEAFIAKDVPASEVSAFLHQQQSEGS